jgi:CDP-6-deoxy-D-xylo-4-hexulose-3-dehydrase
MRDIRLAGVVQGQEEIDAVMRVINTNPPWHVSGPECSALQKELADYIGVKYCVVVNSGSSANLLAMAALDLPKQSYVLTSACGFPATLNPIIHLGHTPVLVDYNIKTLNIDIDEIEKALEHWPGIIKAMVVAHTLGSSLDIDRLLSLCNKYSVDLVEDGCEAIGTEYDNRKIGSFGKVNTVSFYSSHQISGFGGGGALLTNDKAIYERAKSLRDWGKKEVREGYICTVMDTMVDGIPYDQQYTYSTIGYNMRYPDANCAYARAQLKRLPSFGAIRRRNYKTIQHALQIENIPLHYMEWPTKANPNFFGFPVVLREAGLRDKLVKHLEDNGVHVRLFFAGNILRHDAYKDLDYKCLGTSFPVADYLMENAFFCGCWPGLTIEDMEYTAQTIKDFFKQNG